MTASGRGDGALDRAGANEAIVRRAFAGPAGPGGIADLLAPDARWTIPGSGPAARTYHGHDDFVDHSMKPLLSRLAGPVTPHVHHVWAIDDQVIVRWSQDTPTKDGRRYRQEYAYFLTMADGQVTEATGFLDTVAYDDVIARVDPEQGDPTA